MKWNAVNIKLIIVFTASVTTLFSLISSLILAVLDKRREKLLGTHNNHSTEEVVRLSDVRYFPVSFWLVAGICLFYYLAIFPFIALGK